MRALFIIVVLVTSQLSVAAQATNDVLLERRIDTCFTNAEMLEVLNHLALDYKVPIGIEWATNYDETVQKKMYLDNGSIKWKPGEINTTAGSLEDVLDELIRLDPTYRWEMMDGVINIYPIHLRDDFVRDLLNTKIKYFSLAVNDEKFKIRDAIFDLTEIQTATKRARVELLRRSYSYKRSGGDEASHTRQFENISLRSILNATVRFTENKIWVIKRVGEDKDALDLTF